MPFYQRRGQIPPKRHTQFKKQDGSLYAEEVMGTKGFSGMQSILYHVYPPTQIKPAVYLGDWNPECEETGVNQHRHFLTFTQEIKGDPISGRFHQLINDDVAIATVRPSEEMDYFFRNSDGDEIWFVHSGEGILETIFGDIPYQAGHYLVIPVGTTYKIKMTSESSRFLIIESAGEVSIPKRYRNEHGQFMEHSPFCERDIHPPQQLKPQTQKGEYKLRVKARNQLHEYRYVHHPFDVVGWDGFLFPWAFHIDDFEPITGSIHQPPPVHQTFSAPGFVVCSFVPRMYDYHPEAIPAPYFHSNVNSDEVLYYVKGNFMSRKGIQEGSITLHPSGIPHGPHPGKIEASIGKTRTEELAVMVDTFKPLRVTKQALQMEAEGYMKSWLPPEEEE
ncbi:homogentisate 1,2-dioxygenase [Hazenella sp. IB182357]|uniref:Homogentisate 1,2-dioxygenase n=1 Tax=Polycladospora coralii TaxID=2771432 RepID=A0A926N5E8_9BACL|nr:homogentisate 1,2-dioxygenase [Polycladospora coralii]